MKNVKLISVALAFMFLGIITSDALATNYLIFVADDLGRDKVRAYEADFPGYAAAAGYLPQTNTIDSLASQGLRFRRAWANPICSPTRASLQTGLHPYRHGIISPLGSTAPGIDPASLATQTLAESFSSNGYATGYFGKWHIGTEDVAGARGIPSVGPLSDAPHPSRLGWDRFFGTLEGVIGDYKSWTRVEWRGGAGAGTVAIETGHATSRTAEVALNWINSRPANIPWLAVVAFHAPHSRDTSNTWNETDVDLSKIRSVSLNCLQAPVTCTDVNLAAYQALVEHMDIEIEGILLGMETAKLDDTMIFFVGDNGTPHPAAEWDFTFFDAAVESNRGKGTAYETGVGVPMIVADGGTWRNGAVGEITAPNRRINAAVTLTDIYQTLHNHAFTFSVGGDVSQDSISFVDCFTENNEFCNFPSKRYGYVESNGKAAVHYGWEKMVAHEDVINGCINSTFYRNDDQPLEFVQGAVDELNLENYFLNKHIAAPSSWAFGLAFCP